MKLKIKNIEKIKELSNILCIDIEILLKGIMELNTLATNLAYSTSEEIEMYKNLFFIIDSITILFNQFEIEKE